MRDGENATTTFESTLTNVFCCFIEGKKEKENKRNAYNFDRYSTRFTLLYKKNTIHGQVSLRARVYIDNS